MTNNTNRQDDFKFDEMVKRFIEDSKREHSQCVAKIGLIKTREHINRILEIGSKEKNITEEEKRRLWHFKMRIENELAWQSRTKKDYKDADEFISSFVEPSRIDVLDARIEEVYGALNEIIRRMNGR